jgi:hypothetical protein
VDIARADYKQDGSYKQQQGCCQQVHAFAPVSDVLRVEGQVFKGAVVEMREVQSKQKCEIPPNDVVFKNFPATVRFAFRS